jgi:hypothetical protein
MHHGRNSSTPHPVQHEPPNERSSCEQRITRIELHVDRARRRQTPTTISGSDSKALLLIELGLAIFRVLGGLSATRNIHKAEETTREPDLRKPAFSQPVSSQPDLSQNLSTPKPPHQSNAPTKQMTSPPKSPHKVGRFYRPTWYSNNGGIESSFRPLHQARNA